MLCKNVGGVGNGDELSKDILGHLDIVLCNHQGFLDVLVGVALAHQVLNLAADVGVGSSQRSSVGWDRDGRDRDGRDRDGRDRARPAL